MSKKKLILLSIVFVLLFIASYFSLASSGNTQATSPSLEKVVSSSTPIDRRHGKPAIGSLRTLGNLTTPDVTTEEGIDENIYDAEEIARMEVVREVISPHFVENLQSTIKSMLAEQKPDESWKKEVGQDIEDFVGSDSFTGSEFGNIDCYETMCELLVHHVDENAKTHFMRNASDNEHLAAPSHTLTQVLEDGTFEATTYFGRYGDDDFVHRDVADRMFFYLTGKRADDIELTEEQIKEYSAGFVD